MVPPSPSHNSDSARPGASALSIRALTRSFVCGSPHSSERVHALRGVTLELQCDEVVGVVGPSGSGKSTLLRCAAGLLRRDSGSVMWFGKSVDSFEVPRVRYIPARKTWYSFLTVRDVLQYSCNRVAPEPRDSASAIERSIDMAGLRPASDLCVSRLSSGQLQQLAVAEAIAGSPRALLIDTMSSGPGTTHSRPIYRCLSTVAAGGVPVMIAARDLETVTPIASRVVFLEKGSVAGVATVERFELPSDRRQLFRIHDRIPRLVAERVH